MNVGKQFEADFKSSCPPSVYIYRFRDSAASFSQSSNVRFTPSNICDFLMFDDKTRTMYLLELKSVQGKSLSLNNIRNTQIKELTEASSHNLVAGFIVNFRGADNLTVFLSIQDFNKMMETIKKKSFNVNDALSHGAIIINNELKKVRYRYDIENFVAEKHL